MCRKQLAIAFVLGAILLTMAFVPLSGQQEASYDPWLDYNGYGQVDAVDLHSLGQTYGGSGDSTKNVNVTNWPIAPSKSDYEILYLGRRNFTGDTSFGFWGYCGGYSKITLFAESWLKNPIRHIEFDYHITISLSQLWWKRQPTFEGWPFVGFSEEIVLPTWQLELGNWAEDGFWCYGPVPAVSFETKGPYFNIGFCTNTTHPQPDEVWAIVDFYAYLRND